MNIDVLFAAPFPRHAPRRLLLLLGPAQGQGEQEEAEERDQGSDHGGRVHRPSRPADTPPRPGKSTPPRF